MEYNLPHQCLCSFFPTCKCFIFVQTVPAKDISQLELLPESTLDPQFLVQTCHFCNYVFQEAKAKTVKGRHCVNGRSTSTTRLLLQKDINVHACCFAVWAVAHPPRGGLF